MREEQASRSVSRATQQLTGLRGTALDDRQLARQAIELAALLLDAAEQEKRADERARADLLSRLMHDANGRALPTLLTDRVSRSRDPARPVDAARQLLRALGVPSYLPPMARLQM